MNFHFKSVHLPLKSAAFLQHENHDEQNASDSNYLMNVTQYIAITCIILFESVPMIKWSEVLNHSEFNAVNKDFLKYSDILKYS